MLLLTFVVLQALDAATTVVFLHMGVAEGNPLVRLILLRFAPHSLSPLAALAGPKLFAVVLGLFAWRSGRRKLLIKMDLLFALCVAWNLFVILLRL